MIGRHQVRVIKYQPYSMWVFGLRVARVRMVELLGAFQRGSVVIRNRLNGI